MFYFFFRQHSLYYTQNVLRGTQFERIKLKRIIGRDAHNSDSQYMWSINATKQKLKDYRSVVLHTHTHRHIINLMIIRTKEKTEQTTANRRTVARKLWNAAFNSYNLSNFWSTQQFVVTVVVVYSIYFILLCFVLCCLIFQSIGFCGDHTPLLECMSPLLASEFVYFCIRLLCLVAHSAFKAHIICRYIWCSLYRQISWVYESSLQHITSAYSNGALNRNTVWQIYTILILFNLVSRSAVYRQFQYTFSVCSSYCA